MLILEYIRFGDCFDECCECIVAWYCKRIILSIPSDESNLGDTHGAGLSVQ